MAVVYLAEHTDLQRPVAVKILKPSEAIRGRYDFAQWFRVEAQTLASFEHPNVVTLHDFGALGPDEYFLVMSYVNGPRFTDLIADGPMEPLRATRLVSQVCRALRYTHQRGVVHRDIKPSNVMITTDDEGRELVKVIDFGISQNPNHRLESAGKLVIGSPHCMSPEQIRGDEVTHAADIYATGVLLFRAISGQWPFHGDDSQKTMLAHLTEPVPSLGDVVPELQLPAALTATVTRCLQKDPTHRYHDMSEMLRDLCVITDADPDLWGTTPHTPVTIDRPRAGSLGQLMLVAGALLGFGLATASALAWWIVPQWGSPPPSTNQTHEVPMAPAPSAPHPQTPPPTMSEPEPIAAPTKAPDPAPAAEPATPAPTERAVPPQPTTSRPPPVTSEPPPQQDDPPDEVPEGYQGMPDF